MRARSRSPSCSSSCSSSSPSSSSSSGSSASTSSAPRLDVRWLHAGAQHLDLPANPITGAPSGYAAFSVVESQRLEGAWKALDADGRRACLGKGGKGEGEKKDKDAGISGKDSKGVDEGTEGKDGQVEVEVGNGNDEYFGTGNGGTSASARAWNSSARRPAFPGRSGTSSSSVRSRGELGVGGRTLSSRISRRCEVSRSARCVVCSGGVQVWSSRLKRVGQDGLFEVDLASMSLNPVFWAHTGARVPVIRATWFVGDVTHPAEWELAEELEKGYRYAAFPDLLCRENV